MKVTDEMVMAYADGQADEKTRAAVEAAARKDADLAARIQAQRSLRAALSSAYDPIVQEPVPEALLSAVKGPAQVVDLSALKASRRMPAWTAWAAMAACLVLGLAVGLQIPGPGYVGRDFTARSDLAVALDTRTAADQDGSAVRVGISFRDQAGAFCRTFQTRGQEGLAGVACRQDDRWKVRMAMAQQTADAEFRTASALPPAVMQTVESMIAGEPLDAEEEQMAIARDWNS